MSKQYSVYLLTNKSHRSIYTGTSNNLIKRVWEHKNDLVEGFTKRYQTHTLVYYEFYVDVRDALAREKQIKAGPRRRKETLINSMNPDWRDLYSEIIQ